MGFSVNKTTFFYPSVELSVEVNETGGNNMWAIEQKKKTKEKEEVKNHVSKYNKIETHKKTYTNVFKYNKDDKSRKNHDLPWSH